MCQFEIHTLKMNVYYGRDAGRSLANFSREDKQLMALNYENLCDSDYLDRLFSSDQSSGGADEVAPESTGTSASLASTTGAISAAAAEAINHINILGITERDQPTNLCSSAGNSGARYFEEDANRDLIDSWIVTADLPEDLVIFGDAC